MGKLLTKDGESGDAASAGFTVLGGSVATVLERGMGAVLAQGSGETLLGAVSARLLTFANAVAMPSIREELSRAVLNLSTWLSASPELGELLLHNENSLFIKLVEEQLSITGTLFLTPRP